MLLEEIKESLKITWLDEDSELGRIIELSKSYIEDLTGTTLDFTTNLQAKSLLLNKCRYSYNQADEYFEDNFHKEISRLQLREGVKENAIQEG